MKESPAAKAAKPEKVTAAHVRAGLRKYFPHPEFGIVFEVAQSTGFSAHRHLDAIAMDTWPSRGLTISGIEIKVDIYDWRREKANPEKAEQLARFCDKFWIAAPPDLIPVTDLPDAWGLLEGGKNGMRVKKAAAKTKAQPVTKDFMAAIMRASGRGLAADESEIALADALAKLEGEHADKVKREAERLSTNNTSDAKNWRELMEALGESEESWKSWRYSGNKDLIKVIKAVKESGVMEQYQGLLGLLDTVSKFKDRLVSAAEILNAGEPDELRIAVERHTPKGKKK